jgi:hypothetical protein
MPLKTELFGIPEFDGHLSFHQREVLPKATARALNRVAATMRSRTTKAVAKVMGVKQKVVRDRIKIRNARPSQEAMQATLDIRGKALNLVHFKAKQTPKGVRSAPWGANRFHRSAFIVTLRGARVVMVRAKASGRGGRKLVGRLPIRPMLGPGIAKTALDPDLAKARADTVRERMPIELRAGLAFYVRNIKGGAV